MKDRQTVFHYADNEIGYIRAVIMCDELKEFEKLGFVDCGDKIKKPKKKATKKKVADDNNEG